MNSEKVLSFFKEITAIPRESGHEEHIIAYLQDKPDYNGIIAQKLHYVNIITKCLVVTVCKYLVIAITI
jgi:di/tripeptidase